MEIKSRKIAQFRTHYDPMIGGKPQQAFSLKAMGEGAHSEITPIGVYVKLWVGIGNNKTLQEHIVPYANVQSIMLESEKADK